MRKSLAQKYRPQTFADMIGQTITATVLQRMVEQHLVPHALLFSGPSGTGKTSAARLLARELNRDVYEGIDNGSFSGGNIVGDGVVLSDMVVTEVDAASNGGVADIRKMVETLRFYTVGGLQRVLIYDEAHSITREGWNALLKPTEEESGTVFIFVTTEPERIPDTVKSRLREFEFNRVAPFDIGKRLAQIAQAESIPMSADLLRHLAESANGNVRGAIESMDQAWGAGISERSDYVALRGETDRSVTLLRAMLTGNFAAMSAELEDQINTSANPYRISNNLVRTLSDLLVLRSGGSTDHVGPAESDRREIAYLLSQERIVAAMKVLWDLKTKVKSSSSPAMDVRLAMTLVCDVLTAGRQQAASVPAQPVPASPVVESPKKMSLSDMMRSSQ